MRRTPVIGLALSLLASAAGAQPPDRVLGAEESYRRALRDLAAGSVELAVSRVVRLEEELSPRCVARIERHTAELLAAREPEAVVASSFLRIAVHQDRYLSMRESSGLHGFEPDSINTLRDLASLYLEASTASEARPLVAGLLTYLASVVGAMRSPRRLDSGRVLLADAIELDPENVAALHSLAVGLELRWRPGPALPYLERLIELEPENARFRLRRAVVTVKAGRLELGRRLLEEAAAAGPAWTRELATQELARLLAASGREDEAEEVLRRGAREFPDGKLALQLAALLDPEWGRSGEVLFTWLGTAVEDPGPSGRWVYEDGARAEIDALRHELGEAVLARSGALADALRRLPPIEVDPMTRVACR